MQKKNPKTRCERKQLSKSKEVCRLYNKIQIAYANQLENEEDICAFRCNVLLEGLGVGEYTTDFVCQKADGTLRVRECVERRQILWPSVTKLLEASRQYWTKRGVEDWGIVVNKESEDETE